MNIPYIYVMADAFVCLLKDFIYYLDKKELLKTFIQEILAQLNREEFPLLKDYCFVFPTKRACHVFKNSLSKEVNTGFILPDILTINEFVAQQAQAEVTDEIILISKLYEVYVQVFKKESDYSFDQFFSYGKQLISEFDEIDRYMLNANKVFTYISNLEQIDSTVELTEDKVKFLKEFWQSYHAKEGIESGVKKDFLDEWKLLSKVYYEFKSEISKNGLRYEGEVYRELTINIDKKPSIYYTKLFICGFNAFSSSEIRIIKALEKATQVMLFFDVDDYYFLNQNHIAGRFARENVEKFREDKYLLIKSNFLDSDKHINFVQCKNDTSQIVHLLALLKKRVGQQTTIILNDESLLSQFFNFKFDNWENINISMGFPIIKSQTYKLINEIKAIYITAKTSGDKLYLYKKQVLNLLNNPLLSTGNEDKIKVLYDELRRSDVLYVPLSVLEDCSLPVLVSIFKNNDNFIGGFSSLLKEIHQKNGNNPIESNALEKTIEKLLEVDRQINIFNTCSSDAITTLSFIQELLSSLKLTFDTNPDAPIQIMGLLETRALDFENIILLSCNEDFLPGDNMSKYSFIPYLVRRAYDLPTGDEFNSIYSYHFFRILQRAKNLDLFYIKDEASLEKEESRFIKQLMSDLPRLKNTTTNLEVLSLVSKAPIKKSTSILSKTKMVEQILKKYRLGEKAFSATSISLYLQNPYLFALKYGFQIYEAEEETEDIDALLFGSLLHKCTELLYQPYLQKEVTAEILNSLEPKSHLETIIEEAFSLYHIEKDSALVGVKNRILEESMVQVLKEILEEDKLRAPFRIVGLEQPFEVSIIDKEGNTYRLKGTIDRIDEKDFNGAKSYNIIDYKTGKTEIKPIKEDKFDEYFNPNKKFNFQGLFYALLLLRSEWKKQPTEIYFYGIRGKKYESITEGFVSESLVTEFEEKLIAVIKEILNLDSSFDLNPKDKYAENSPYARLLP